MVATVGGSSFGTKVSMFKPFLLFSYGQDYKILYDRVVSHWIPFSLEAQYRLVFVVMVDQMHFEVCCIFKLFWSVRAHNSATNATIE